MGRPPEPDRAAEDNLRNWEAVGRDDAVRDAAAAGLSVARIQKITGLATTTIMDPEPATQAAGVPARPGPREPPAHRAPAAVGMNPVRRLPALARAHPARRLCDW